MTDLRRIFFEGAKFGHFHLKREEISEHDQKIYELEAENRFPKGSIPQALSPFKRMTYVLALILLCEICVVIVGVIIFLCPYLVISKVNEIIGGGFCSILAF